MTGEQKTADKLQDDSKRRGLSSKPVLAVLTLAILALIPSIALFIPISFESALELPGNVLLVTAHPDDETVFFGPSLTSLRAAGSEVYLLCLTKGNARGIGELRKRELKGAANALQIDEDHLTIEDDELRLPDSKILDWDLKYAKELIHKHVQKYSIDTILTFDRGGITGHKNHKSCWQAVRSYMSECRSKICPKAWSVVTKGNRQYRKVFDLSPSASSRYQQTTAVYVNRRLWRVFWAMHYHKSQWRWWSHVLFTRYTYVNTLQAIHSNSFPAISDQ